MKTGNTNDLLRGMAIRLAWRRAPNRQCAQQVPTADENGSDSAARAALLSEVDFKWLMAGQGCWIDIPRFHRDPAYSLARLEMGLQSSTYALRQCAAGLQDQLRRRANNGWPSSLDLPANELGIVSYAKPQRHLIHKYQPRRETSDSSRPTVER